MRRVPALCLIALAAAPAAAQHRFLIADRTNDAIWRLNDANANRVIEEPGEINLFFNSTNAAGTLGSLTQNCQAIRRDGLIAIGDSDSTRRNVILMRDLNGDGDALDAGESRVVFDSTNASGIILSAPQGAAFDSRGRIHMSNAGSAAAGADAIYRFVDLNGDGDFQDAGEITEYVGVPYFGAGNGPRVPIEIVLDRQDVLWMRESSAGFFGVYRFQDLTGNGRADDAGEATTFFDTTNLSLITVSAGFGIDLDPIRPGSIYFHNLGAGSNDQVFRLTDLNADGDANDAGEAVVVYATAEAGFTSVDVLALYDGRIIVTDASAQRAVLLTDLDADGLFTGAGERTTFFGNTSLFAGTLRQANILACPADWDHDKSVTPADVASFINDWVASLISGGFIGDFDFDGSVSPADVAQFVNAWFNALLNGC